MLNVKLFEAYGDLYLKTNRFDATLKKVLSQVKSIQTSATITVSVDRSQATATLNLLRQQMLAMKGRANGRINIKADLSGWSQPFTWVIGDLNRARRLANIPVRFNTGAARASLNRLLAQLAALRRNGRVPVTVTPRWAGGRGFGGGGGGGGFLGGAMMGAGIPAMGPEAMAGYALAKGLAGSAKVAVDLESEFADLRRITGMTSNQMAEFKGRLLELSHRTPGTSTQDLIEMAQIGGRMGVADREGVGGLSTFAEQMARVKLAVGDGIGTEDMADRMARILNVFDLGTERVSGFGSALVALDNISTASAKDILDITTRLAGTAQAIRMTLPETLALASALKDVGLTNEVAGSAMDQILRKMAANHERFADEIGVDAGRFADAYRRGPLEALGMVIAKMNEVKDTIKGQELLAGFGLRGVRVGGALQALSTKFPEVARRTEIAAVETGNEGALKAAQAIKGDTAAAQFGLAKNAAVDLADAVGSKLLPVLKWASGVVTTSLGAHAQLLRGQFPGDPGAAPAPLAALPAKNPDPVAPATLEEAWEARGETYQAFAKASDRRDQAAAEHTRARQALNQALRDQARGVAGATDAAWRAQARLDGAWDALQAAVKKAAEAQGRATKANADLIDAEQKRAEQEREWKRDNDLARLREKAGAVLGAAGDIRQRLGGILGRAANGVLGKLPFDAADDAGKKYASVGHSGDDVGRRLQEDVLNQATRQKDLEAEEAAKRTADHTRPLAGLLGEIRNMIAEQAGKVDWKAARGRLGP